MKKLYWDESSIGFGINRHERIWLCEEGYDYKPIIGVTYEGIDWGGEDPNPVAEKAWRDRADYICRAVNSHDRLIEALEAAIRRANRMVSEGIPSICLDGISDIVNVASAALAAARGEGE